MTITTQSSSASQASKPKAASDKDKISELREIDNKSAEDQIKFYDRVYSHNDSGGHAWQERWQRLSDAKPPAGLLISPKKYPETLWKSIPHDAPFKQFQRTFCPDFVVPIQRPKARRDWFNLPISGCLVAPSLLSLSSLQAVGIISKELAEQVKKDSVSQARALSTLDIISSWKSCVTSSLPLQHPKSGKYSPRIRVIGAREVSSNLPKVNPEAIGQILYFGAEAKGSKVLGATEPRQAYRVAVYPDIFAAGRRATYVASSLRKESLEMQSFSSELDVIRKLVEAQWFKGIKQAELEIVLGALDKRLLVMHESLKFAQDEDKVGSDVKLTKALTHVDSRGHPNKAVHINSVSTALKKLEDRTSATANIRAYTLDDDEVISRVSNQHLANFRIAGSVIKEIARILSPGMTIFLDRSASQKEGTYRKLLRVSPKDILGDIKVQPFKDLANCLSTQWKQFDESIRAGKYTEATTALASVDAVIRFASAFERLSDLKQRLKEDTPWKSIQLSIKEGLDSLEAPFVCGSGPKVSANKFSKSVGQASGYMDTIHRDLIALEVGSSGELKDEIKNDILKELEGVWDILKRAISQ